MGLYAGRPQKIRVALLAEGVDRNKPDLVAGLAQTQVALLAEGVDRNCTVVVVSLTKNKKVIDNSPFGWYNNMRRQE